MLCKSDKPYIITIVITVFTVFTVLLTTSELHLESALEILVTIATKWGMKLNYGKTKLVSYLESSCTPCHSHIPLPPSQPPSSPPKQSPPSPSLQPSPPRRQHPFIVSII